MDEHIVKQGSEYCLRSKKTNKNLGCYGSKGGAEDREKQVQYFKHLGENEQKVSEDGSATTTAALDGGFVIGKTGKSYNVLNASQSGDGTDEFKSPEVDQEIDPLEEMSGMGVGGVEGGFVMKNKKKFEHVFVSRRQMLEEMMLRETIRTTILTEMKVLVNEEMAVRDIIRLFIVQETKKNLSRLLTEAKTNVSTVHASTGINVLEDLLKKIVPSLEQDYKSLATSEQQRESYRAHILNAVQKTLAAADINQQAQDNGLEPPNPDMVKEHITLPSLQQEVDVNVGTDPNDAEKFIDIDKKPSDGTEEDTFTIAGKDKTGRNMAQISYDKIEKQILDSYSVLSDDEDKKLFYDYLLTNLVLYFDRFESEMETDVKEPNISPDSINNV